MKNKYKIMLIILGIIILIFVISYFNIKNNLDNLLKINIHNVDLSKIEDGTYNGSYGNQPVYVKLSVVVKDKKIESINIIKHDNGKGKPAEKIINDVIEKQSLEVDTISGATYSSKVILLAINDALNK